MVRKKRSSAELTCTDEGCTGCDGDQAPVDPAAAARLLAVREPSGSEIPCADSESVLFVARSTGLTRIKRDVVQLAVWRRPEIPPKAVQVGGWSGGQAVDGHPVDVCSSAICR